jgi:hypothetical protein
MIFMGMYRGRFETGQYDKAIEADEAAVEEN